MIYLSVNYVVMAMSRSSFKNIYMYIYIYVLGVVGSCDNDISYINAVSESLYFHSFFSFLLLLFRLQYSLQYTYLSYFDAIKTVFKLLVYLVFNFSMPYFCLGWP